MTIFDHDINDQVDMLIGEAKIVIDDYASHSVQTIEDQIKITKRDLAAGTLGVIIQWEPDTDQFMDDIEFEPPVFE